MRIVVLGDFHLNDNELDITEKAMEDVKGCLPDLVVPLGDFGSGDKIGGVEGLEQAYFFLKGLGIPIRPILGNHDLQRESGDGSQKKGTMQEALCQLYDLQEPYGVIEYDQFRLFFISTDPQPKNLCYQVQECYVSETQYSWLVKTLHARPGVPAIFFTHAPPAGCGLRTVPKTHVRATNAYLDQNHDAYRWLQLIQDHPEIVMWFSAHYHLSHMYPDSCTNRYGTTFFTTGVHGNATRDGKRQSRVIDITDHGISVFTLDHENRGIKEDVDWDFNGTLAMMAQKKVDHVSPRKMQMFTSEEDSTDIPAQCISTCSIGEEAPLPNGILAVDTYRCLVATVDGFLWEVHHPYETVMGTIHWDRPLVGVVISDERVWRAWDRKIVRSHVHDLRRFVRDMPIDLYENEIELPYPINSIAQREAGGVWASCANDLVEIYSINKLGSQISSFRTVHTFQERIQRIISDAKGAWILTDSGLLSYWDEKKEQEQVMFDGVIDWDVFEGEISGAIEECDGVVITYKGKEHSWKIPLNMIVRKPIKKNMQILCLGKGRLLVVVQGTVYFGDGSHKLIRLDTKGKEVTSISRVLSQENMRFGLGLTSGDKNERPQLQVWECNN